MYLLSPVHTRWLAATTIATTITTRQESLQDFLGDPLVCRLKSRPMFSLLPGRPEAKEGNPLSADVNAQTLSRFKGLLGRDEKKRKTHRHTP